MSEDCLSFLSLLFLNKNILVNRGVFETQPDIYDGAFLQRYLAAFSRFFFLQKHSITDVQQGSKYGSGESNGIIFLHI